MMGLRGLVPLVVVSSLALNLTPPPSTAAQTAPASSLSVPARVRATGRTTTELIDAAVARGRITRARGNLLQAFALARPGRLPSRYRSSVLVDGTTSLLRLHRIAERSTPLARRIGRIIGADGATERDAAARVLTPSCSGATSSLPSKVTTSHFLISYDPSRIGAGLTLHDYVDALERAWTRQVDAFGWAAPPPGTPGGRYHVRVERLRGYFGYVSASGTHAGLVGDNPSTSWNDQDAYASCMVLNANLQNLAAEPRRALSATAAHELNHAIQFGYGTLIGPDRPDDVFIEGGATWIEDEAADGSNDNYRFLWPSFYDSMGAYGGDPYAYWVVFRAITEPLGSAVPGGGEDVLQGFWEAISRRTAENLDAFRAGLEGRGVQPAQGFHAAAIRLRVLRRCGSKAYAAPVCLEEASDYVAEAGPPPVHGRVGKIGGVYRGGVKDDFGLNWVALPTAGTFGVRLANTSGGGQLRASLVCDDGSRATVIAMPQVVSSGEHTVVPAFDARACQEAWAVITNHKQSAANPYVSTTRTYALSIDAAS
jgi:hypothetical protein